MTLQLTLFSCWENFILEFPFFHCILIILLEKLPKKRELFFLITRGEEVTSFQLFVYFKAANCTK